MSKPPAKPAPVLSSPGGSNISLEALPDRASPIIASRQLLHWASDESCALSDVAKVLENDLQRRFERGEPIAHIMRRRALGVVRLLRLLWRKHGCDETSLCLLAVGGSGRGELHPYSDVDLLILHQGAQAVPESALSGFIHALWDLGWVVGHSVRSVAQAIDDARDDVVFLTNVMEARWLAGEHTLLEQLQTSTAPEIMWPAAAYYQAKRAEQQQRHERFQETAYNLEPNIKGSPGGLRDVQMITWVALRRFGGRPIEALVRNGLLTRQEAFELKERRDFLWRIRWGLHRLAKRAEERLLFEYQTSLAQQFGYEDVSGDNRGVEQFMQQYYRTVMKLERLNERVLQQYQEEFVATHQHRVEPLDDAFQIHNGYLEVRSETVFIEQRERLLTLFLWLQKRADIQGVRASTIRLVRQHLSLIDEAFCQRPETWQQFLAILKQSRRLYRTLQRMNRYGVLAALIAPFRHITGRMQFDLFHAYTVDQHTLFVIRNLRRFANGRQAQEFSHAIDEWRGVEQAHLLYLAGLFHDIAKGRGGDHSELGAEDAAEYCRRMQLSTNDQDLVVWLVRHHLLLSQTAQRQDISDPEVVQRFAEQVGSEQRLRYLYLLSVADIAATAPRLWTSWKDSLMWELFRATQHVLQDSDHAPVDADQVAIETQQQAIQRLSLEGYDVAECRRRWQTLAQDVFVRLKADQLAWMTAQTFQQSLPCVVFRLLETEQVSELFIHTANYDGLFASVVQAFDKMRLNVLSARVITGDSQAVDANTTDETALIWDVFQLVDANGQALVQQDQDRLARELKQIVAHQKQPRFRRARVPRRLRQFLSPAQIRFENNEKNTLMWLECTDRPGLLSLIAEVLLAEHVRIHDARIATLGDRVEDLFVLSDRHDQALTQAACDALSQALKLRLDAVLKEQ